MARGKFAIFTVIGCSIWCAALAAIGYSLGSSWHHVIKAFSYAGYIALALVIIALVLVIVHRVRTLRTEGSDQEPPPTRPPRRSARGRRR